MSYLSVMGVQKGMQGPTLSWQEMVHNPHPPPTHLLQPIRAVDDALILQR
jgi:hypothetical protein